VGAEVSVTVPEDAVHIFDAASGVAIRHGLQAGALAA
jgi:hypothetical protein